MNRKNVIDSLYILVLASLLTGSLISLENMRINVVTQSPFFLYNNIAYTISVAIIAIIIMAYPLKSPLASIATVFTSWSLLLLSPYTVYLRSLPLYNDQLGFVLEALQGIMLGHIKPVQGEFSSLGHAYFTSLYSLICGFESLQGVIVAQIMLPMLYILPLLAVRHKSFYDKILVPLVVLAAMLNPLTYGRTVFAWSYLVLLTVYLYNTVLEGKAGGLNISTMATFTLVYTAFVISDPTSLIVPMMLLIIALFNRERKLTFLAVSTTIIWFAVNVIVYVSGSFYSAITQLMALIEQPANPLPSLIAPPVNTIIKLYNYLRELTVFLNFFIGLISIAAMVSRAKKGVRRGSGFAWVALYLFFMGMQVGALTMNRWGMVPYSIYTLTLLPLLVLLELENGLFKKITTLIVVLLLVFSPVVKWGFSPIAFPTPHDLAEMNYLVSYTAQQVTVCASGAHVMADFYYKLYNLNSSLLVFDPLPQVKLTQVERCDFIGVFYKSLNTYRLGVSEEQLEIIIAGFDQNYSVIYRDHMWTIWLK